jgi:hypothetical protein
VGQECTIYRRNLAITLRPSHHIFPSSAIPTTHITPTSISFPLRLTGDSSCGDIPAGQSSAARHTGRRAPYSGTARAGDNKQYFIIHVPHPPCYSFQPKSNSKILWYLSPYSTQPSSHLHTSPSLHLPHPISIYPPPTPHILYASRFWFLSPSSQSNGHLSAPSVLSPS